MAKKKYNRMVFDKENLIFHSTIQRSGNSSCAIIPSQFFQDNILQKVGQKYAFKIIGIVEENDEKKGQKKGNTTSNTIRPINKHFHQKKLKN